MRWTRIILGTVAVTLALTPAARAADVFELPAAQKVAVGSAGPTVSITSIPSSPTNQFTFGIDFTASEPDATFECKHFWPDHPEPEIVSCTSGWSFRELPDGQHRFEITAIDALGNRGPTVGRDVTIDAAVPDPA